jgi:hypothetical protein
MSTLDITENLLLFYEFYAVTLPVCTVAIDGKAMYTCCGTVLDVIPVPTANFQKSSSLFLTFDLTSSSQSCDHLWTLTYREL